MTWIWLRCSACAGKIVLKSSYSDLLRKISSTVERGLCAELFLWLWRSLDRQRESRAQTLLPTHTWHNLFHYLNRAGPCPHWEEQCCMTGILRLTLGEGMKDMSTDSRLEWSVPYGLVYVIKVLFKVPQIEQGTFTHTQSLFVSVAAVSAIDSGREWKSFMKVI